MDTIVTCAPPTGASTSLAAAGRHAGARDRHPHGQCAHGNPAVPRGAADEPRGGRRASNRHRDRAAAARSRGEAEPGTIHAARAPGGQRGPAGRRLARAQRARARLDGRSLRRPGCGESGCRHRPATARDVLRAARGAANEHSGIGSGTSAGQVRAVTPATTSMPRRPDAEARIARRRETGSSRPGCPEAGSSRAGQRDGLPGAPARAHDAPASPSPSRKPSSGGSGRRWSRAATAHCRPDPR